MTLFRSLLSINISKFEKNKTKTFINKPVRNTDECEHSTFVISQEEFTILGGQLPTLENIHKDKQTNQMEILYKAH